MTVIKAGYRVSVKTWENDADNYNNGSVEGLTRDEALFVVAFAKLFTSQNNHQDRGIGNMYEPSGREIDEAKQRIKAVVERHIGTVKASEELAQYFLDDDGKFHDHGWHDYAYELTLGGGEFFTRVMDELKVEFIPVDVHLQDVTGEFV